MGIDIVDVIARSFRALVGNRAVLAYAAIGGIISALFYVAFLSQFSAAGLASGGVSLAMLRTLLSLIGLTFVGVLSLFLVDVFIRGSVISAANTGAKADIGKTASQALNRYITLLVTLIVVGIAVGIGFILLIIPGIYLAVKLSMAPIEAVVGKKGVVDSLSASWHETDGNFWTILGAAVLMWIALFVIVLVAGLVFRLLALAPVANFVSAFVSYAFLIMLVFIYQQIAAPSKRRGAKTK